MCFDPAMGVGADELPDDVAMLKAMVIAATARAERLEHLLSVLNRQRFGKSSEKLAPDQLALALEDSEAALAEAELLTEQELGEAIRTDTLATYE